MTDMRIAAVISLVDRWERDAKYIEHQAAEEQPPGKWESAHATILQHIREMRAVLGSAEAGQGEYAVEIKSHEPRSYLAVLKAVRVVFGFDLLTARELLRPLHDDVPVTITNLSAGRAKQLMVELEQAHALCELRKPI